MDDFDQNLQQKKRLASLGIQYAYFSTKTPKNCVIYIPTLVNKRQNTAYNSLPSLKKSKSLQGLKFWKFMSKNAIKSKSRNWGYPRNTGGIPKSELPPHACLCQRIHRRCQIKKEFQ